MKRLFFVCIFFLSVNIYADKFQDNYEKLIEVIKEHKNIDSIVIDYKDADYFLENNKINEKAINELILIFPNMKLLKENEKGLSNVAKEVIVFTLKHKPKSENLECRSIEDITSLENVKNIQIVPIILQSDYEKELINYLDNDTLLSTTYFKNVIYPKYLKLTKYRYVGDEK